MTDGVRHFANALDRLIELQEELLRVIGRLRRALVEGDPEGLTEVTREAEARLHSLNMAERRREAAAGELASDLGIPATRWADMRDRLDDDELGELEPRIEALENVVRRLELANAVNDRMIRHDIAQVDFAIRLNGVSEPATYSGPGATAQPSGTGDPIMLNTIA